MIRTLFLNFKTHFRLLRFDVRGLRHVCGTEFQEILIELVLFEVILWLEHFPVLFHLCPKWINPVSFISSVLQMDKS
jgi:hypothetical protein